MPISLRLWNVKDAVFVCWLRNDPKLYRWFRQDEPISLKQQKKFMQTALGNWYIAEMKGKPVGIIGRKWFENDGELSLVAPIKYHKAIIEAFRKQDHRPLWGEVFVGNPALKIYLNLGFEIVSVKERAYYKKGYGLQDVVKISVGHDVSMQEVSEAQGEN